MKGEVTILKGFFLHVIFKKITKGGYPEYGKIKFRKDEILKLYPNISKARKIIKWIPRIEFNRGLKSTIFYYKKLYII